MAIQPNWEIVTTYYGRINSEKDFIPFNKRTRTKKTYIPNNRDGGSGVIYDYLTDLKNELLKKKTITTGVVFKNHGCPYLECVTVYDCGIEVKHIYTSRPISHGKMSNFSNDLRDEIEKRKNKWKQ
jgi:hypothetical protein